jgi:hypothetical protein
MAKNISVASYWLGIACVVLTIIFRGLAAVGIWPNLYRQVRYFRAGGGGFSFAVHRCGPDAPVAPRKIMKR